MSLKIIDECFTQHQETLNLCRRQLKSQIEEAASLLVRTIKNGNTVFLCGNGGSAADAQHIAAEFTGRFVKERKPLPAIALTTDTSALTAIGNDYNYSQVFSRQVAALGKSNDLLIALSTSGKSANVIEAIKVAKAIGLSAIGLSGKDGGEMKNICDLNIIVPSTVTARIQEMHILIGHIFCTILDNNF